MRWNPKYSRLVLPSGQKVTLKPLAAITLELVLFCMHMMIPVILAVYKCIQKSCSVRMPSTARFCLVHLSHVKPMAFQLDLQLGEQRSHRVQVSRIEWVGHVVFGQNICDEQESVRWFVVVMQQPVHLSSEFGALSSHIFTQLMQNITADGRIALLGRNRCVQSP